jgi:serine/threonine-protein kinase
VAVKVMARELAANPEALARFHREAVVTSGLGHPHIVQVLDFITTPTGEPFLVMEFLDGEDLDRRLRRAGRLWNAERAMPTCGWEHGPRCAVVLNGALYPLSAL